MQKLVQRIAEDKELIETLWNVNSTDMITQKSILFELIETLWNVNMLDYPMLVFPM